MQRVASTIMTNNRQQWRWTWHAALLIFIIAASTGSLMRFGNVYGFPYGLQWANIRHAHSHLMFFGWVTPALMGMIFARLPLMQEMPSSQRKKINILIIFLLIFALAAYSIFLLYGYSLVPVGNALVPLAVMISGLSGVVWYGYLWQYKKVVKGIRGGHNVRLWNGAVWFLFLASMAAWGVAITARIDSMPQLIIILFTHLFLDLFSEGWFVLGVLGLIYASFPEAGRHPWAKKSEMLLFMGIPIVFLLSIPTHLLPMSVRLMGSLAALLVGLGLGGNVIILWPHVTKQWRVPLFFLGLKATVMLFAVVPSITKWAERGGLHVSYLHWMLLGFVTLGLVAAAAETWGESAAKGWKWMTTAVFILILTLLPLTAIWPPTLSGRWVLHAASWATVFPILIAINMFVHSIRNQ